MKKALSLISILFALSSYGWSQSKSDTETAVFGAGCFWCVEAVFQEVKGVQTVESGYAGGSYTNPTYKEVCSGKTGHAEVAKITFNPNQVSFETLLSIFFKTHDPTTLNYQGADYGTQYRSVIFYTNEIQKQASLKIIQELNRVEAYPNPIVTEVKPLPTFWKAENYHHDYFSSNPNQSYCTSVIHPKFEKFRIVFEEYLK